LKGQEMGIIHRFKGINGNWDWEGVPLEGYGSESPDATVRRFISRLDGSSNIEMRYFELQSGAHSNLERHNYEHGVLILRGQGTVRLGTETFPVRFGDTIYIPPNEIHQFRAGDDVLGFMCVVLDPELRAAVHGEQDLTRYSSDG
jgi:quercetin dioxygenase-like cupin family protein